jgi:peroxiredoxin
MSALTAEKMAPHFTLPTLDGHQFSLAHALQQGPVVLAFFKISCPVCQYAFPYLERIHRSYQGKVRVVGVSQNGKKDTALFCKEYGVHFPVVLDDPGRYQASNAYGITNVPTVFLVAPGGAIEVSSVGWSRPDIAEINRRLAEVLQYKPVPPVFRLGEQVEEFRPG